jgi:L-ascorbate metabolism protein UlaG (beta-lactamase superfamily)
MPQFRTNPGGSDVTIRHGLFVFAALFCGHAFAATTSSVQYLANEGVMVIYNDSKVLFDPLFDNSFNMYQMVPDAMRAAIMAGTPPYDEVDAVFISHYHDDHFSAVAVLSLLRAQDGVRLYAPLQAVAVLREIATDADEELFVRVTGLDLDYGDPPVHITTGDIDIDAIHVPHSGWPTARTDVQNIAFRITLEGEGTVVHLGDADARLVHFSGDSDYWSEPQADLALPPYWFFASDDGNEVLESIIDAGHAIGIHVPAKFADPNEIPEPLQGVDLFTYPGETRTVEDQ